jgi:hypothetical protein
LKMMAKVKVPSISSIMNLENPNKKVWSASYKFLKEIMVILKKRIVHLLQLPINLFPWLVDDSFIKENLDRIQRGNSYFNPESETQRIKRSPSILKNNL